MLAALFLAGLLGAVATVWLSGPRDSADLDAAAGRIATCDRLVRDEARARGSSVQLAFDPDGTVTEQLENGADENPERPHVLYRSMSGVRLARMILAPDPEASGRPRITVSPAGISRSYAVEFTTRRQSRWLVIAGLTGNVTEVRDEQQVSTILAGCGTAGDDAH